MALQTMSFSKMQTFTTCQRKYRYAYVERIKRPPSSAMVFGISGHSTQEYSNKKLMKRGKRPRLKTQKEYFDAQLKSNIKKGLEYDKDDSKSKMQVDGIKAVEDYETIAPTDRPLLVEESFEIKFSSVSWRLNGFIDLAMKDSIVDYKYSSRKPSPFDPKLHAQLLIYRFAAALKRKELRRKRLEIHLVRRGLIKNGAEIIKLVPKMTESQVLNNVAETARAIVNAERSGDFPMNLNQQVCGWCQYKDLCGL